MKLLLNGQELNNLVADASTLGSTLAEVQKQKVGSDDVISQIWVDGELLTAERLADWKARPASEFNEARVEAQPRKNLVSIGLNTIRQGLTESADLRNAIVTSLQQGQIDRAMHSLADYLGMWNTTQKSIVSACHLMDCEFANLDIDVAGQSQNIHDLVAELTSHLQDVKTSIENRDFVMLADLLNYEFEGLTATWETLIYNISTTLSGR